MNSEIIKKNLSEGTTITLTLHSLNETTQKLIYSTILELLTFYNREGLFTSVYTALFESTMNAVKASAKKAFFQEKGLPIYDEFDFKSG